MLEYKLFKGSLYIKLSGELDQSSAPALRARIDSLIASSDAYDKVIIDMSALNFMDSAGVGLIMGRYKMVKNRNKILFIRSPSPAVDKVLNVSGIYSVIPKIE
jgi:anti-anti-sigma factor